MEPIKLETKITVVFNPRGKSTTEIFEYFITMDELIDIMENTLENRFCKILSIEINNISKELPF